MSAPRSRNDAADHRRQRTCADPAASAGSMYAHARSSTTRPLGGGCHSRPHYAGTCARRAASPPPVRQSGRLSTARSRNFRMCGVQPPGRWRSSRCRRTLTEVGARHRRSRSAPRNTPREPTTRAEVPAVFASTAYSLSRRER
jgi:hypothetical protein